MLVLSLLGMLPKDLTTLFVDQAHRHLQMLSHQEGISPVPLFHSSGGPDLQPVELAIDQEWDS